MASALQAKSLSKHAEQDTLPSYLLADRIISKAFGAGHSRLHRNMNLKEQTQVSNIEHQWLQSLTDATEDLKHA